MSRSRRKTPIFGYTTCRSERDDKKIWHQRWRAQERTGLTGATSESLEAYLPLRENEVSNTATMSKDGRQFWPIEDQTALAERLSTEIGQNSQERSSLKVRLLRKWMSK